MSETVLGERLAEALSTGGPCTPQGNGPGGMSRQAAAWPQTRACLREEKSAGAPSPSRTAGAAPVSTSDALGDPQGVPPRHRGLVLLRG